MYDLFAGVGIDRPIKTKNNHEVMTELIDLVKHDQTALFMFANCVDFDELYGHRNDPHGFAQCLNAFDPMLGELLLHLRDDDLLIVTADHGNDPTITTSTDHSREFVPLLVRGRKFKAGVNLGCRDTFADVSATISEYLRLDNVSEGTSFLSQIYGPD